MHTEKTAQRSIGGEAGDGDEPTSRSEMQVDRDGTVSWWHGHRERHRHVGDQP